MFGEKYKDMHYLIHLFQVSMYSRGQSLTHSDHTFNLDPVKVTSSEEIKCCMHFCDAHINVNPQVPADPGDSDRPQLCLSESSRCPFISLSGSFPNPHPIYYKGLYFCHL